MTKQYEVRLPGGRVLSRHRTMFRAAVAAMLWNVLYRDPGIHWLGQDSYCLTCGRQLGVSGDRASVDCGGDCLACIEEIEGRAVSSEAAEKLYESVCELSCAFIALGLLPPVLVVGDVVQLALVNYALAKHFGPGWWGGTAPDGGTALAGVRLVAGSVPGAAGGLDAEPQCPLGVGAWR